MNAPAAPPPAMRVALPPSDAGAADYDGRLGWTARWSLTSRILAVNIFALAMLAGSFAYLDGYREQLADDRLRRSEVEARLIAEALAASRPEAQLAIARRLGAAASVRLRIYDARGVRRLDSWALGPATYQLRDPSREPWRKHAARFLDRAFDEVVGAPGMEPFVEPRVDRLAAWPEARAVAAGRPFAARLRRAPDQTPVLSAAVPLDDAATLLMTQSARDITRGVRAERLGIALVLGSVLLLSVLLSLFLARTIVRPLRRLAIAAQRVRLGRAREVVVPRLPSRHDEIGLLARSLSDMSQALRYRIDQVEAFAADVAHELKNPLASLASAVDSLEKVRDPALQARLLGIVREDVVRLDRLVTDIAEVSRLDAELSRTHFARVDLGPLIEALLAAREARGLNGGVRVAFARPFLETATVEGDPSRLARLVGNLVDNAVSFSPAGGLVEVSAVGVGEAVRITVDDEGPGVPPAEREAIFRRFHSSRPEGEAFGTHSGLGLAIARTIAEGHDGRIEAGAVGGGRTGARFTVHLPRSHAPAATA